MTSVALSRLHYPVTTLGPGRRVGLWFQGCSIRCAGCISTDTWDAGAGRVSLPSVVQQLERWKGEADGLTVSGGEPFDQPEALAILIAAWRGMSERSIFVFTGYERNQIEPWLVTNPGLIDAIMTGPFRSEQPQTMAMRGSDNQTLHVLSALGSEFLAYDRLIADADRRLDIMFDDHGDAWIAGIPARGDLGRLRRALAASGHRAETSDRAPLGKIS